MTNISNAIHKLAARLNLQRVCDGISFDDWDASKHPRGNSKNKGQFAKKGTPESGGQSAQAASQRNLIVSPKEDEEYIKLVSERFSASPDERRKLYDMVKRAALKAFPPAEGCHIRIPAIRSINGVLYRDSITVPVAKEIKEFSEREKAAFESDSIEDIISVYRDYQKGKADKDNFFKSTIAKFTETSRPKRAPDYESRSKRYGTVSSRYWYTNDGVYRESNHWGGGIASCAWYLTNKDGVELTDHQDKVFGLRIFGGDKTGFAKWDDILYRTSAVPLYYGARTDNTPDAIVLSSFDNPCDKETCEITYDANYNIVPLAKRFNYRGN